jgi:hypothetical protein
MGTINENKGRRGRPRSVSSQQGPPSEGNPVVKTRVNRECAAWVKLQPFGWLRSLVESAHQEAKALPDVTDYV